MGIIGALIISMYGLILNGTDVTTDILNGLDYISRSPLPTNYSLQCDAMNNWSHPVWGGIAIGLAWLPALPIIAFAFSRYIQRLSTKSERNKPIRYFLFILFAFLLWPIMALFM